MPEINITMALLLEAAFLAPAIMLLWRSSRHISRLEFRVEQLEKDRSEGGKELSELRREVRELRESTVRLETKMDLLLSQRGAAHVG